MWHHNELKLSHIYSRLVLENINRRYTLVKYPAYLITSNISPSFVSCSGRVIEKLNAVDFGSALFLSALNWLQKFTFP